MKWCWVFWKLMIPTSAFVGAKEIMVRATDEASNRQPRDCTWNLMGMGNNNYFRIKIHNSNGVLRFEHPDLAGMQPGGWLTRKGGKLKSAGYGLIADIEEANELEEAKQVRVCEEQSDELKRRVYWILTYMLDTSICNGAAAKFYAISNVTDAPSIATRFARRSKNPNLLPSPPATTLTPRSSPWPRSNNMTLRTPSGSSSKERCTTAPRTSKR